MGNRLFVLLFLIAALSFLFVTVSAIFLYVRKKFNLSFRGILWLIFFVCVAVPIVHENSLLELHLFTDYTGGMRIEVHEKSTDNILRDDIYISKDDLVTAADICVLVIAGWMIGTTAHFSFGIAGYFNNLHFLTKHSAECYDERIIKIFDRAKKKAGIRRSISLRIMKSELRLSPCTCGVNFPAVYIGSDYLRDYSDLRLELVFLHELIHIKHHDTFLKLLTLGITSFFSFIPFSRRIKNAISEDVEFCCDNAVLEIMGDCVRSEYVAMIIDVAERNLKDECRSADFLSSVSRSGEMIISRYKNMKGRHSRKSGAVYAFPVLVAAITLNMAMMSVLSVKNIDNLGVDLSNPLLERAVCQYLGISDPHDLTENDIASVYSLEFALSDLRELAGGDVSEKYALTCTLNEGLVWNGSEYSPAADKAEQRFMLDVVPEVIRCELYDIVLPPDTPERIRLRECYDRQGSFMILENHDKKVLKEYILAEYNSGELEPFFIDTKEIETGDIVFFSGLRTLIFSDRLKSSDEAIYLAEEFAVISRED